MTTRITIRDWEALSAYLDNQLKTKDRVRLESRLNENPELRSALDELRRTQAVLRSQPRLRAPRNFTLTAEMAGVRTGARPMHGSYPVLRLASILATIFFIVMTVGDLAVRTVAPAPMTVAVSQDQPVAAPFGMGGGGGGAAEVPPAPAAAEPSVMEASAPTEAAAIEAPVMEAFALTEEPAMKESAPTEAERVQEQALGSMASEVPDQKAVAVTPLAPLGTPTPAEAAELLAPGAAEAEEAAQPAQNVAPAQAAGRETTPATGWLSGLPLLRILQILLAVLAIGAGLAALYLRRSARD
jgi:anti-sigma factor RsiW